MEEEKELQVPGPAGEHDQHVMVSDELLTVIAWLVTYEQETLKKILVNAMQNGLQEALTQTSEQNKALSAQEIQSTIFDLFTLLEELAHEVQHESEATTFVQRSLVPAINRIDMSSCNEEIVSISAAKATAAAGSGANAKEVLCRELLRRWKPAKKSELN